MWHPIPLLLPARKIASGSAKENFRDLSILRETTEGDLRSPARAKPTTDYPKDLFPMVAWPNIHWTSPGVALLVSIAKFGKILLCPRRDGVSKNIQDLARVRLPAEDCGLR